MAKLKEVLQKVGAIAKVALPVVARLLPAGGVASAIVSALLPTSKAGAAPTAVSTSGYVQTTLAATTTTVAKSSASPSAASAPKVVPKTIGIAQQSGAAVQSVGSAVHVPVNSSGLGIFTQEIPPVSITQTGMVSGPGGLLAKAPSVGNVSNLLPSSQAIEKVQDVSKKASDKSNAPTNPTGQPSTEKIDFGPFVKIGAVLLGLFFGGKALGIIK